MKSTLIVRDLDKQYSQYHVKRKEIVIRHDPTDTEQLANSRAYAVPEDFFVGWFLWNLRNDRDFRRRFQALLQSIDRLAIVEITPPCCPVAAKSSEMSLRKAHEYTDLLTMLSWFSTFGGAYSNLGDEFEKCAEMAAKISVHQMKLAFQLGDPFLISRCKLYYSIALIQRGFIGPAKRIVRSEYEFARKEQEADPKLLKMCLGIWSKLVYTKQQKQQQSINRSSSAIKTSL